MGALILGNVLPDDLGRRYSQKIAGLSRNSPFYHDHTQFTVYFDNPQLSDLSFGSSHPSGHLLPLVDTPRSGASTNRTQGSVTLGTVSHQSAMEIMSFDSTCKGKGRLRLDIPVAYPYNQTGKNWIMHEIFECVNYEH